MPTTLFSGPSAARVTWFSWQIQLTRDHLPEIIPDCYLFYFCGVKTALDSSVWGLVPLCYVTASFLKVSVNCARSSFLQATGKIFTQGLTEMAFRRRGDPLGQVRVVPLIRCPRHVMQQHKYDHSPNTGHRATGQSV